MEFEHGALKEKEFSLKAFTWCFYGILTMVAFHIWSMVW